jgi:hypothetical protein
MDEGGRRAVQRSLGLYLEGGGRLERPGEAGRDGGRGKASEVREGEGIIDSDAFPRKWGSDVKYDGEFDPGSELTLAARLKHASRTGTRFSDWGRVANG